jgi:hypothetical protein
MALDRGLREAAIHEVSSEAMMEDVIKAIPIDGTTKVSTTTPASEKERESWEYKLFDLGDVVISVRRNSVFNWGVQGAAKSREKLDEIMTALQTALPPLKATDPNSVPVSFWSQSPNGAANRRVRRISVPSWCDVEANYAEKARTELENLMGLWPPIEDNGRLLLWHGVPGTGKSYGIRSLAQAWHKWCDVHYIVDPEKFFGDASYMLQVILQSEGGGSDAPATECGKEESREKYTGPPWNLLIMEDSDEFLTADAKDRTGQSMSRLLNLTSGFIGQGLNILVLITTNEPIKNIHDALQREGRCMANIEFGKLSEWEAQQWATKKGAEVVEAAGEQTIADLYAMTRKQRQLKTGEIKKPMGFAGMRS